jgi:outer membrane protein assembly factor BamA
MRTLLFLLLSFAHICISVSASGNALIHSVRFFGNKIIAERDLLEAMVQRPGNFYSHAQLAQDLQSIMTLCHERGFYFAEVYIDSLQFSNDSSSVELFIGIIEGNEMSIADLRIEGNSVIATSEILRQMETHVGGFLDRATLENDINAVLSSYERIGYPFAAMNVKTIALRNDSTRQSLDVVLAVEEGSKVRINEIRVAGNKETKENVIVRETRIASQELFSEEKVMSIRQRLNRLNIFSSVQEPELYVTPRGGGLLITVQEGNTNTFDGILGYVPSSVAGGEGAFTGMVNVSMRNLFGTARKLNIHWQRDDPSTQEIAFQYVEPWVLNFPVNLSGGFRQRQQDSSYIRRGVDVKADILVTESFSIGGIFNNESIIPSSTLAVANVSSSSTMSLGLEIQYDTRNDALSPTSGVNYRTAYQMGNKKITSAAGLFTANTENSVQRISLDADMFFHPIAQQVLALGLHGRQLTSGVIELGDLYRFGGTNTLRGYRENEFLGSRVAWTNTEYRFLLAQRSYVFGFFDTGYFFLPGDDTKGISSLQHFKYGYGIGVRLETNLGNIGVSFAFGEGDSFSQGKIHVGLMNEF